jgi:hypothetical protein
MIVEAKWLLGMDVQKEYSHDGSDGSELQTYLKENRRKLLNQHAIGTFFDKDDPSCKAYFGELPLSFAVSRNSFEFVKFLVVDCDCWIDNADKNGHTAAHLAVYHDNFAMFVFLWKLWVLGMESQKGRTRQSRDMKTHFLELESHGDSDWIGGYTPLVYAAHLGRVDFFTKLWDYMGRTNILDPEIDPISNGLMQIQWKWGSIRQFLYPLEQIDPIGQYHFFDTDLEDKEPSDSPRLKKIALESVPLFESVLKDSDTMNNLMSRMILKKCKSGSYVLRQGEKSNGKMYIIQQGCVEIIIKNGAQEFGKCYLSARYFGELGAFGRQIDEKYKFRSASIKTVVDSDIWEIDVPTSLPQINFNSQSFVNLRAQIYKESKVRPCVLTEALSKVRSNIMRRPQDEECPYLRLFNTGLIKELIDKKWKRFGALPAFRHNFLRPVISFQARRNSIHS